MNRKYPEKRVHVIQIAAVLLAALAIGTGPMLQPALAGPPPTVSVSNVVVNSGGPVCNGNDTGSVTVTATVAATFDTDSGPTPISSNCDPCRPGTTGAGNNNCNTGNTAVNSKLTVVTRTKTYTNKQVLGHASDNNSASNAPNFNVSTGNFDTLPTGPEGKTTVTARATASELETITDTTTITYWTGGPTGPNACTGTNPVVGPTPTNQVTQSTKTSNPASASGSYLVDKIAPTVTPGHPGFFNNPPTIMQTQNEIVHLQIKDGSAGTPWSVTVTATGPDSSQLMVTHSDTFGSSPDGIKAVTNAGPFTLPTACDTPVGSHTVEATVSTQDLCGASYPDINVTGDDFTVTPGITLATQTGVLSQLTTGEYGIDQCFTNSVKQQAKKLIVNNTPGSVHIDTIVTTAGPCADLSTISGVVLELTLPPYGSSSGFVYTATGASPNAHIFVGDGSSGFDLHNGMPLTEVTDQVTQTTSALPSTGQSQKITIDLSKLGNISATDTIFARAHVRFKATSTGGQPGSNTAFRFSSSASTAEALSDSSDYYISGNPTQEMDNLTGALLGCTATTPEVCRCNADGLFIP